MNVASHSHQRVLRAETIGARRWRLTLACEHVVTRVAVRAPAKSHCDACTPDLPAPSNARHDEARARYLAVRDLVQKLGSQTAAARELGISRQAVSLVLAVGRRREEGRMPAQLRASDRALAVSWMQVLAAMGQADAFFQPDVFARELAALPAAQLRKRARLFGRRARRRAQVFDGLGARWWSVVAGCYQLAAGPR